jgi:hypothetical protein
MDHAQYWLAMAAHNFGPNNLVERLLAHGEVGMQQLRRAVSFRTLILQPEEYEKAYLPFYSETKYGPGAWWSPEANPKTMTDWGREYFLGRGEHRDAIERLQNLPAGDLEALGPSVLAQSGETMLIVDGCKRACAAYAWNVSRQFLIIEGDLVPLLFPSDFLAIKLYERMQADRPTTKRAIA